MSEITARLNTAIADRYRIERELGAGGMATVYLAHDVKHERKVALKVLRPELAAVIGAERFLAEIKVTANLQHPHILPLHDSGEADSFLYYVMPYVEGETLRDKIEREKQLGVDEAVEIARSVAAALDYAHRHEVVHRDIKPENILIHDGQPMVADFGIALAVSQAGGTRLTETGLSVGTPHYMSPEQAMGDRELDARSDVYSLGAMLYEMLAGEPPYTGPTAQAIVAKVITEKAPPVTAARRQPVVQRGGDECGGTGCRRGGGTAAVEPHDAGPRRRERNAARGRAVGLDAERIPAACAGRPSEHRVPRGPATQLVYLGAHRHPVTRRLSNRVHRAVRPGRRGAAMEPLPRPLDRGADPGNGRWVQLELLAGRYEAGLHDGERPGDPERGIAHGRAADSPPRLRAVVRWRLGRGRHDLLYKRRVEPEPHPGDRWPRGGRFHPR
jgi:serine/threonine protein kinase